jgi:hypothetical protein
VTVKGKSNNSVADPGCLSRILDPNFYIPDLNFSIPDLESRIHIKEIDIFLTPVNFFSALRNITRVVHPGCGSRIRILIFYPSRIPNLGVKKAPDPGSGSATLCTNKENK